MPSRRKRSPQQAGPVEAQILDRAHLMHYTMENIDLEREIIDLFLGQLPGTVAMIGQADSPENWKLATHTLKGSAAAVGARRINTIACQLDEQNFDLDVNVKKMLLDELAEAVADFRAMAARIYSVL